ncbi:DNA adenine methylase [Caldicellulosiruptor changbaiensis]|uniref:Site-specific DNA-methyltransferase (adenine-specific) n=1 Tax=Caldicellulosiruptor changbaiensis TaxID=1222016 RepID=A0A3T0D863_9FIRM|nr:DNA adenine methylase [Caldicellulosiruptor changbaiensis]AZT91253.1 DNA adenine methylase [Caldicellulosiruptor changbaiensis]
MRTQLTFLPQKVLPIVKWAGGKRQIIDKLMKKKPKEFSVYFEPFLGGGALLIELYNRGMLKKAVVSDINFDLINLYIVIKTCPEEIIYHIKNMEFKNNSEDYYRARDYYNSIQGIDINSIKEENIIKAALLLYLNRHCYNGLYRVNNKGEFNVPFGSYKNPKLPSREEIFAFSEMLQNIEILHMDFEEAVKNADSFDFVYFDPPYMPISKTAYFTDYTVAGFTEEDQIRLKNVCDILTQKGCYVMVSNSDSEFIRNLYKDYNIETIESRRSINSSAEKRRGHSELIITNY